MIAPQLWIQNFSHKREALNQGLVDNFHTKNMNVKEIRHYHSAETAIALIKYFLFQ